MRTWVCVLLMALALGGCGHLVYSTASYQGAVVDKDTRQPLVGAVVVAIWYREAAVIGGGHGPATDYHDALEVLTNADGGFSIPEKTHFTLIGKILEPDLVAYYPGYAPYPSANARPDDKERVAAYEQKVFRIELPQLLSREERFRRADIPVSTRVPRVKIPNVLRLVNQERVGLGLQPVAE